MRVVLSREFGLWVVRCAGCKTWIAGLMCEAGRSEYIKRNGYEVVR